MASYLFYSPYNSVWDFTSQMMAMAQQLLNAGNEVAVLACGRTMQNYCVSMENARLPMDAPLADREAVCRQCVGNAKVVDKVLDFPIYYSHELLSAEDYSVAQKQVDALPRSGFENIEFDGLPIGRRAVYDVALRYKLSDYIFSDEQWAFYGKVYRNCILMHRASRALIARLKPDRMIFYNDAYSVNGIVGLSAEAVGVETFALETMADCCSARLRSLRVGRQQLWTWKVMLKERWPEFHDQRYDEVLYGRLGDHVLELMRGSSSNPMIYSAAYDPGSKRRVRDVLGIPEGVKVLTCCLSCEDEFFAEYAAGLKTPPKDAVWGTQLEWVRSLSEFVRHREDLVLVVRMHPRDFPNHRDLVSTSRGQEMIDMLATFKCNRLIINAPDQKLSVFDLGVVTDVGLVSRSNAGRDLSLMGVPVVVYTYQGLGWSPDIANLALTEDDYFAAIERLLQNPDPVGVLTQSWRYHIFAFFMCALDLGTLFNYRQVIPNRSLPTKVLQRLSSYYPLFQRRELNAIRRYSSTDAARVCDNFTSAVEVNLERVVPLSEEEERRVLAEQMRRLRDRATPPGGSNADSELAAMYENLSQLIASPTLSS